MAFMVYTVDRPDGKAVRDAHRAAHFEYLRGFQRLLLASGGTFDEEFAQAYGSCILLDVSTRAEAQAFVDGDPFHRAGLAETVIIVPWKPTYLGGVPFLPTTD